MSETVSRQVSAKDHVDHDGSIVESARILGQHVVNLMQEPDVRIILSFEGLKGLTSSYFTMFLRILLAAHGVQRFREAVTCNFDSALQRSVFDRSWDVISKEAA